MTSDHPKSEDGVERNEEHRFELNLLVIALVLLLGAWTAVMLVTGSSWWGFDEKSIDRIATPELTLEEESR